MIISDMAESSTGKTTINPSTAGSMLKRAWSMLLGSEKGIAVEYERWSKIQLIQRIQELENERDGKLPASIVSKAVSGVNSDGSEKPDSNSISIKTQSSTSDGNSRMNDRKRQKNAALEKSQDEENDTTKGAASTTTKRLKKAFDMSNYNQRFVAIRFAYTGWNYNGLAIQNEPTPLPTVEEVILKALNTAKFIESPDDPKLANFSRCGRTDKGVSALNQVISLNVRSRLTPEEQLVPENDEKEIPYATALNSLLPTDIRITSVCLRPPQGFDARFSCLYRHYKYIFDKLGLDLELMQQAAQKYVGRHDFRNFCKIDGSKNITNYERDILGAKIIPLEGYEDYYVFDLKGTAFLWHQVRCMMAILLLIGQKLEKLSVIDELFDVDSNNGRPLYDIANDIPLILYDCVYPEMEWVAGTETSRPPKMLKDNQLVRGMLSDYQLKSIVTEMVAKKALHDETGIHTAGGLGVINIGDGKGRNFKKYTKVMDRDVLDSFEVSNAKHKEKKRRRREAEKEMLELK